MDGRHDIVRDWTVGRIDRLPWNLRCLGYLPALIAFRDHHRAAKPYNR
jgi:hypothetical protein